MKRDICVPSWSSRSKLLRDSRSLDRKFCKGLIQLIVRSLLLFRLGFLQRFLFILDWRGGDARAGRLDRFHLLWLFGRNFDGLLLFFLGLLDIPSEVTPNQQMRSAHTFRDLTLCSPSISLSSLSSGVRNYFHLNHTLRRCECPEIYRRKATAALPELVILAT